MAAVEVCSRYGDLCRLCATKTTLILGINIFENEGSIRQISKKIETCLPVHVHQSDELPNMICENCLYKLELFFDFREKSIRTERLLIDLIKEINNSNLHKEESNLNSIPLDHTNLIMVPHHQLLHSHNIQNVEIDLSHLHQRDGIIVGHEIILSQHNINMNSHSLDHMDLDHHELTQDLSNHSLQTQDSILLETTTPHSLHDTHFTDDSLDLIHQQQILSDQFRLQHDLQVNISEVTSVEVAMGSGNNELDDSKEIDGVISHSNGYEETNKDDTFSYNVIKNNSNNFSNNLDSPVYSTLKTELCTIHQEDSNSENSLLIDDRLGTISSISENGKVLILQTDDCSISSVQQEIASSLDCIFCNICGKTFQQKTDFENHYEEHFNKCGVCLAVFTTDEVLHNHIREVHGANVDDLKTQLHDENTDNSEESDCGLDDSIREEEEEVEEENSKDDLASGKRKKWTPKVCKECGKSYKTNYKLTEHMRKHTGEKPYKCASCDRAFRSKIGLAQHEAKHTGQYDFACPICGKGFQCKSYLMVHQRVHSDVKPYPCTTCGSNFKTKQSLLDHTNRHLGVKPFMCDVCGRGFITKGLCKAHQKVHTGTDNRKYSCKVCSKMFVSKSYLQTHLRIHTGEKPFMCEVCGKGFLTRVDLRIHSTMHTGEKSYVCEICGKAFARRDALRCHRRSHTGERPYSCDLCGQTFTQFTPMAIHKRLHTGERPYACETCGKTFVSRSTMMCHAKKHVR